MSFAQKINQLFRRKPIAAAVSGDSSMMGDTVVQDMYDGSLNSVQGAPSVFGVEEAGRADELVSLPILGTATTAKHQRTLFTLLGGSVLVLVVLSAWMLREAGNSNQQLAATGQALMQSQRLAKSVSIAMTGAAPAFADVKDSAGVLARNVRALAAGDSDLGVNALGGGLQDELSSISTLMERAEKSAGLILGQQKTLTQVGDALRTINRQSSDLLETAETISSLKLQQGAGAAEISAAGQLVMLTQRIAKSANEFQTLEGVSPEAVFLLGKDLNSFKEISEGLLNGSAEMRLSAARDPQVREQLETLIKQYDDTRTQASAILGNLQGLVSAREAQTSINNDSEPLRQQLEQLQTALQGLGGASMLQLALLAIAILTAVLSGIGISRVQLLDSRARQQEAERHQVDARLQEQEAKRINDANQAAILRLMNELQSVAEGDLTQEATVTEDITGAIADSVNYTVEELRALVGSVQNTVTRVAQTTEQVDVTSTELLAASNEQLHEIRETGKSILDMAGRINNVSAQAQESAQVARQSLQAADSGLKAVQNAIGGMNSIRDQIQDTSKRIKRLGESSQEIGEITELISDITEQTNVLALNAAIQAASAGEAGRGFSVVAEEVQRLAERSADATRQIAALVKAIQTDTQDAVAAMERSTQGVVEGARLSDSAGTALSEIDSVSRRLAELIEQISNSTSREANMANGVAENIQHIFAVTEQTGEGTRTTAQQVRELSHMAEELRQSVSRFKIA
ncbi:MULTISPECIES: methyl-accepting chemotaxis protein [Comamonas]|uniref:Methyl-accepting chemotaxis protein n=1 Tax=Comamonas thiooxydans TaxID=363952 RepID=A0AA42TTP8_9BURK|nr:MULTISPECIES: methyl-accepting chemotaxis protein [Comamonas]BCX51440.1 protein PilJ [Comamonas testosteroni]KKI13212.1 chemotaxis protein [Comamonas thiooxydans]MDH1333468.1 methyl-accepting chemotaxis protein [Comamonas thiooxydans]MDH1738759.1 methyl-accepting chemotaxis protein [Comamonas thiooxydans]MDH1788207.1 methyl-accepting chemotaxis protein [Comamonas thiooxydans]